MKKIAVTGNIASGKTVVENKLKEYGFKTLCLDEVTKAIYEDKKVKTILYGLFNTDKKEEISKIVFADKEKLKKLEDVILPEIKQIMFSYFDKNKDENFIFVIAPTLFEAGFDAYFDKIIFISSNEDIRLKRLIERNNVSFEDAKLKIDSQLKEEEKTPKCSYILYNNSSIEDLLNEIEKLKEELSTL